MSWKLFLDDVREPIGPGFTLARSTAMAVVLVIAPKEFPTYMSLDHDLGEGDDAMRFLKELHYIWEKKGSDPELIPEYVVHSENPIGAKNIISYMETWRKIALMD